MIKQTGKSLLPPFVVKAEYSNTLDMEAFSLMLKDPSFSYKFYWLEALVHLVTLGVAETTLDEIISEMIADAWYSVREYHIHLSGMPEGKVLDGLERAVQKLAELSNLPGNAEKATVLSAIREHAKDLKPAKEQLTHMVPYRALAGFLNRADTPIAWGSVSRLTEQIRQINADVVSLPYVFGDGSSLNKEVIINPVWADMICDNQVEILGWINCEKLRWLQTNNPEVPNMVYKLESPDLKMRKLSNVHKLWDGVIGLSPVRDMYNGVIFRKGYYDIDHFIPWSFVMNDELWNLAPIDPSLNSSKSNHLPPWEKYFKEFADRQYLLYRGICQSEVLERIFRACAKDNLHSLWAIQELYRKDNSEEEFKNILQKNMLPVYDAAKRQGYSLWGVEAAQKCLYTFPPAELAGAVAAAKNTEYAK